MIGNDVIDLNLAKQESNPFRRGYLDKICTIQEQHFIRNHPNPEFAFWVLWSRKEAVYKLLRQQGEVRGYYPVRIENTDPERGWVVYAETLYFTQTESDGDLLHTVALTSQDFETISELSESTQLFKTGDIPCVWQFDQWVSVSKSHHGRFQKIVTRKPM